MLLRPRRSLAKSAQDAVLDDLEDEGTEGTEDTHNDRSDESADEDGDRNETPSTSPPAWGPR